MNMRVVRWLIVLALVVLLVVVVVADLGPSLRLMPNCTQEIETDMIEEIPGHGYVDVWALKRMKLSASGERWKCIYKYDRSYRWYEPPSD